MVSSSNPLNKDFNGASNAPQRARIDARTVGYPVDGEPTATEWMGMSPAPGKGDGWYVLIVQEQANEYLRTVNKGEALVQVNKVIGNGEEGPLTFEKAVEYLAVWEFARYGKGSQPVEGQSRRDLGKHYFKDLLMRRGYLVDTTGTLAPAADILPQNVGRFLKTDIEALQAYQDGLRGENILNELIQAKDPIFISETTLDDDLESFGDIGLFDKMHFFADVLVKYADIKLGYVQEFYADPTKKDGPDLTATLAANSFFDAKKIAEFNAVREELAWSIFRYYHVAQEDWGKILDFNDPIMKKELLKNPDAAETAKYLTRKVSFPLTEDDIDTILFTSARAMVYFREMLKDSPQKDAMERKGVYKEGDINDLLNYLDLLEIKYQYRDLAESALALPGTQKYKDLAAKKEAFKERVASFKDNVKHAQDYSPAMEKQIDGFIRASTPIYLIDRIAGLPDKIARAKQYISDKLLPKPQPKLAPPQP